MKASKQTRLKLRKGFHKAPISYRVLMISQFNKEDEKEIAKGLIKATTPVKAEALMPVPGKPSRWSMRLVSFVGNYDVRSLHFKGSEVAVFWKRQTSEVIPDPSDPVPEGVLENPDDVWVRFDLFTKSPRQLLGAIQDDLDNCAKERTRLQIEIDSLQRIKAADSQTIKTLQGQLKALEATRSKKKTK